MLQVPCLSPPIYGRSHYKKFWLRQTTEVKDPSSLGVSTSCDHMKSASTATGSSPDLGSPSKRICGKRRPQLRSTLSSSSSERIKVAINHESGSPTSSGEFHGWKATSKAGSSDAASSPFSSTVVDAREADLDAAEEETPKSLVIQQYNGEDHKFLVPPGNQAAELVDPAAAAVVAGHEEGIGEEEEDDDEGEEEKVLVVRQNMISFEDEPSSEQTALDCLTSKCKAIDHELPADSRQDQDTVSNSSAESDSTTSSTSQASDDHDDARSQSEKSSSFRQYVKRHSKGSSEIDQLLLGSPRTRLAAATSNASIDNPVSPSGRSPRLDGMGSVAAHSNNNVSTRTCKHCGTMKTPLWRNGPLGPKSLCNACGIRLRKARRNNMNHENGGNGQAPAVTSTMSGKRKLDASATPPRIISGDLRHPYKKSRLAFSREKREMGSMMRLVPHDQQQQRNSGSNASNNSNNNSSGSSKFGNKSLSKDEEEGAVLLMALSCGLVLA